MYLVGVVLGLLTVQSTEPKTYPLRWGRVSVDGVLDDAAWGGATRESGLSFPWQDRAAPTTVFRALRDATHLYFAFDVEDADIVIDPGTDESAIANGDRVELFFSPDRSLEDYICLEIDPAARVLDYRASFYREFDRDWDLRDLTVAATRTDDGYVVEGSVPLRALPLAADGSLITGVFRAEFSNREGSDPLAEWISWVRPDSEEPDFHVPSAFGRLEVAR